MSNEDQMQTVRDAHAVFVAQLERIKPLRFVLSSSEARCHAWDAFYNAQRAINALQWVMDEHHRGHKILNMQEG